MYAPYMAFSSDYGAITSEQSCVLVVVFAEPVSGLSANQFKVTGPNTSSITALKLLQGTSSYYHLLLQLPSDYTGIVTVTYTVGHTSSAENKRSSKLQQCCNPFGLSYTAAAKFPATHLRRDK
jgi:hypothetical protein